MSCPIVRVPNMKANDAEPRIQPYSNSFPANRGLAALTDNASAREVVGAREAAWITVMKSSNAKECAHNNAAAEPAANAVQIARARRNEPANGLFLPELANDAEKLAKQDLAKQVFVQLLERFNGEGRNVSHAKTSNNYAPKVFAEEANAIKLALRKGAFEAAMRGLFAAGRLKVEDYGKPSQGFKRLAVRV